MKHELQGKTYDEIDISMYALFLPPPVKKKKVFEINLQFSS